jgi:short-subunit dehydrogenase
MPGTGFARAIAMANDLKRKFAVITGASSGIGFELARQCLEHGFDVLICAEDATIMVAATKLANAGNVIPVQADLATYDGVQLLDEAILATHRPVDALLLNAGIGVGGSFLDTPLAAELEMIALNCIHTVHVGKRVIPRMVARGRGQVLITGSIASGSPNPYQAVYGATEAFVAAFGEALRAELRDANVTVTVLLPGPTETNFFRRAAQTNTRVGQSKKDDPAEVARQGLEAMLAGRASAVPGSLRHRALGVVNDLLPETIKAVRAARATKPLS